MAESSFSKKVPVLHVSGHSQSHKDCLMANYVVWKIVHIYVLLLRVKFV